MSRSTDTAPATPRRRTRLLWVPLILLLTVAGVVVGVPLLLEGPLGARVTREFTADLDVDLAWDDLDISVWRAFPDVAVTLTNPRVTTRGPFAGERLLDARAVTARMGWGDAVGAARGGPVVVRGVRLDEPVLRLVEDTDGHTNWSLGPQREQRESEPDEAPARGPGVDLPALEIVDGGLSYEDLGSGLAVVADDLDLLVDAGLRAGGARLTGTANARSLRVTTGETAVLDSVPVTLGLDGSWDKGGRALDLTADATLAALGLSADGRVTLEPSGAGLALDWRADSPDLAALLSLLPSFDSDALVGRAVRGRVTLDGTARGPLSAPLLQGRVAVDEGHIGSDGAVAVAMSDIGLRSAVSLDVADPDSFTADVERLTFSLADEPFTASGRVARPLSALDVDIALAGALDLAALRAVAPLTALDGVTGRADLDLRMAGPVRRMLAGAVQDVSGSGTARLRGVRVPLEETSLWIEEAHVSLDAADLRVSDLDATLGASDAHLSGRLEAPLATFLLDAPWTGELVVRSRVLELDELLAVARPAVPPSSAAPEGESTIPRLPRDADLDLELAVDRLRFQGQALTDVIGRASLADGAVDLSGLRFGALGGDVTLTGRWDSAPASPEVALDADLSRVSLRDAMRALPWLQEVAPIAAGSEGRVSALVDLRGRVEAPGVLAVESVEGRGGVRIHELRLDGSETLGLVADQLALATLRDFVLDGASLDATVADGRVMVEPFRVALGPVGVLAEGSHGFEGSLDWRLDLAVPARSLLRPAERGIEGALARALARTPFPNLDVDLGDTLRVVVRVGGTLDRPRVSIDLDEVARGVGRIAEKTVRAAAAELVDDALDRADAFLTDAREEAERVRQAALAAAERTRDQLVAAAEKAAPDGGNPLARLAARSATRLAIDEADRAYDRAVREANEAYDEAMERARVQSERLAEGRPARPPKGG